MSSGQPAVWSVSPGSARSGLHLPQLLQADAVALRVATFVELEARDQLAAEAAARALGEDRVLGVQLHAELEVRGRLAVLADAEVAGGDAAHVAAFAVQHLGRGKAGEDLDAERFGLRRQPAHDVAEADDVVAFVAEAIGQQGMRRRRRAGLGEEEELVAGDRLVERRALFLPVGDQLVDGARIHDRAREDVRAGLRALLEDDDRDLVRALGGELLEADRGGQPGRAGADDRDVVFHRLAGPVLGEDLVRGHRCLAFLVGRARV